MSSLSDLPCPYAIASTNLAGPNQGGAGGDHHPRFYGNLFFYIYIYSNIPSLFFPSILSPLKRKNSWVSHCRVPLLWAKGCLLSPCKQRYITWTLLASRTIIIIMIFSYYFILERPFFSTLSFFCYDPFFGMPLIFWGLAFFSNMSWALEWTPFKLLRHSIYPLRG